MRYITSIPFRKLREKYDIIAGWGNGSIELERRYTPFSYKLDCIINGQSKGIGEVICGNKILGPNALLKVKGKICFILFTNKESILVEQINEIYPKADTIVGRLVLPDNPSIRPHTYSTDYEDLIFLSLIKKLGFKEDFPYMDIGVCHPVVRNNTFKLYERGYTNGLLVEPNPSMTKLSLEYRSKNKILNVGVGERDEILPYITYKDERRPGQNHFQMKNEEINPLVQQVAKIPVININKAISENFEDYPFLLDIDAERMDYSILKTIDINKYPIKIICAEKNKTYNIRQLLQEKGYTHFTSTLENMIFVKNEDYLQIS